MTPQKFQRLGLKLKGINFLKCFTPIMSRKSWHWLDEDIRQMWTIQDFLHLDPKSPQIQMPVPPAPAAPFASAAALALPLCPASIDYHWFAFVFLDFHRFSCVFLISLILIEYQIHCNNVFWLSFIGFHWFSLGFFVVHWNHGFQSTDSQSFSWTHRLSLLFTCFNWLFIAFHLFRLSVIDSHRFSFIINAYVVSLISIDVHFWPLISSVIAPLVTIAWFQLIVIAFHWLSWTFISVHLLSLISIGFCWWSLISFGSHWFHRRSFFDDSSFVSISFHCCSLVCIAVH